MKFSAVSAFFVHLGSGVISDERHASGWPISPTIHRPRTHPKKKISTEFHD